MFSLFGWVVWLFFLFFLAHFDNSNVHCLLLQDIRRPWFPVSCGSLCFLTAFCFVFWLSNIWLLAVLLVLFLYFFFQFLFVIFLFLSPFLVLSTFLALNNLLVLALFLVLPCAYTSRAVCTWMGDTWTPLTHTLFPFMICGGHVPPHHPCQPISTPHTLVKIVPCDLFVTLFALFCACWVLMHPPAPIRTHIHTPESLLTPLCMRAHICLFWGNLSATHGRESYPATPFMSLFVLFVCA